MKKLVTILGLSLISLTTQAFSLQESMQIAFERNPRTQANDLRLKAMQERTHAAWLAFLPTFNMSYSVDRNQFGANSGEGWRHSDSSSRRLSYSLSMNIYDGGARYYGAKAAEASEKAREAQFNSTNTLIPNTKGAIASLVFNAFTDILRTREQIEFTNQKQAILNRFMEAAATSDDRNQIQGKLNSLEVSIKNLKYQSESGARDFEYVVKIPAPFQMDDYEQTIANIEIPSTPEQALEVALEKSPELKVASYQLEAMQLDYKADRASTYSPQINAHVGRTHGTSRSGQDPYNQSNGTSAGLTLSWSFSASRHAYNKAAALEVEAAQKEKDGAQEELKYNIESTYPELANFVSSLDSYERNFEKAKRNVEDLIGRLDKGEPLKLTYALGLLEQLEGNFYETIMMKQSVLSTKFKIQKTIGTLFEQAVVSSERTRTRARAN